MKRAKRIFILGAGFSKPAGMPLATELLPLITQRRQHDEMRQWLDGLQQGLVWLSETGNSKNEFSINIEEVFHYAYFHIETHRLRQQLVPVGRKDGPDTPWNVGESIRHWLSLLEDSLRDVIVEEEDKANLEPITRWAESLDDNDCVVTFNYDTLVERALTMLGKPWSHGLEQNRDGRICVFKMHGSIDWIVAERSGKWKKLDLLFDKPNTNRSGQKSGDIEEDYRLWRCQSREQLREWISTRDLQSGAWKTVGIAGLGAYKQLHQIPGIGAIWANAMRALYDADLAVIVGFSMSNFDAMAQIQFAEIARQRQSQGRLLPIKVVDPFINVEGERRFYRVFRHVDFEKARHEEVDWSRL